MAVEVVTTDIAHGGEAIGRLEGKAHFVAGALPGERIRGDVVRDKKNWARVELTEVIEPSPDRVVPPCPHFAACGGCQWQYAEYAAQLAWKQSIVAGQLAHLGGIEEPPVADAIAAGGPYGYRNRMDFRVVGGRPALFRHRSRTLVPLDLCMLLHPNLVGLFERLGDLSGARSLTLRTAVATAETLAVVTGDIPSQAGEWGSGVVHKPGRTPVVGDGTITEIVGDTRLRITADAFFQNNTAGAGVLAGLVADILEAGPDDTVLDAYAGGGLLGLTAARSAGRLIAIESDDTALADLRFNAEAQDIERRIVPGHVEEAAGSIGERWDLAIVDPPRTGLGAEGVRAVVGGGPRAIAYVSCDPAALARRDTRLLQAAGYRLLEATPVDIFPQTFHIETVAAFAR